MTEAFILFRRPDTTTTAVPSSITLDVVDIGWTNNAFRHRTNPFHIDRPIHPVPREIYPQDPQTQMTLVQTDRTSSTSIPLLSGGRTVANIELLSSRFLLRQLHLLRLFAVEEAVTGLSSFLLKDWDRAESTYRAHPEENLAGGRALEVEGGHRGLHKTYLGVSLVCTVYRQGQGFGFYPAFLERPCTLECSTRNRGYDGMLMISRTPVHPLEPPHEVPKTSSHSFKNC